MYTVGGGKDRSAAGPTHDLVENAKPVAAEDLSQLWRGVTALLEPGGDAGQRHAARLATGADASPLAAELRARLVDEHPDAPEAAEASLELARWHATDGEGVGAAVRILETLIVEMPNSAVVPAARRELQRLQRDRPGPRSSP